MKQPSDASGALAKLRGDEGSTTFDAFMKKDISPFKMNFNELERE